MSYNFKALAEYFKMFLYSMGHRGNTWSDTFRSYFPPETENTY